MSEPLLSISPGEPLRPDGWIDLHTAAKRANYSGAPALRHVIRAKGWMAAGLARLHKAGKGKPILQVHETADPRFARAKSHDQVVSEWSGKHLTQSQRDIVFAREKIVLACENFCRENLQRLTRSAAIVEFAGTAAIGGKPVAWRTLYNWIGSYRRDGRAGLEDGRAISKTTAGVAQFYLIVRELYLTEKRMSKQLAWEFACKLAATQGVPPHTFSATARYLRKMERDEKALVIRRRDGAKAHNDLAKPYIERDYSTLESNQEWNGDQRTCDVIVNCGGKLVRPFVTAWEDTRSRKIVGWHMHAEAPNSEHVLLALRNAVHPELGNAGVPGLVYIDNGKTYDCWTLQGMTKIDRRKMQVELSERIVTGGVFGELGVTVTHCEPYHGQSKPIERFFRTMKERFCRTWETFCGGTIDEKPESLPEQLKKGLAPTLELFREHFATFVDAYNATPHRGHAMDRQTPQQVWLDNFRSSKRVVSVELADVLLLVMQPAKVHRNGVTVKGLNFGVNVCIDRRLLGKDVIVRYDPASLSTVSLWEQGGRFIEILPANERVSFRASHQDARAAIHEKRRLSRVRDEYAAARPRMTMSVAELANSAAALRAANLNQTSPTDPTGPGLRPIQTPLAQGAKDYQKALEHRSLRLAVGAESRSLLSGDYQPETTDAGDSSSLGSITSYLSIRGDAHE